MQEWVTLPLAAVSGGVLLSLLIIIIFLSSCRRCHKSSDRLIQQKGLRHHRVTLHRLDKNGDKKTNYFVSLRGPPENPIFRWADHPSLVTEAVENGWSGFGFVACSSSPTSVRRCMSLFRRRQKIHGGDQVSRMEVDITREATQDGVQKIQFRKNSGTSRKIKNSQRGGSLTIVKTILPLPGPALGNSAFPEEAYFEITILSFMDQEPIGRRKESEGEKIKLIQEKKNAATDNNGIENLNDEDEGNGILTERTDFVGLCVGLTGAGDPPAKIPGTYPGSVGFNSNASVFLAGTRLVGEWDSRRWGRAGKVIGIGHNTAQNKVFFTVDSNLLYEIHCESEEFGSPLHPTISAAADEADITVSVNLGQTHFKYAPANLRRTPNPCFTMTEQCPSSSPGLGCGEDSRELFSMGRIDSEWLMIGEGAKSRSIKRGVDDDDLGSDGDLFEIALDGSGKSPNVLRI
ncbi:hypothetical protein DM860_006624 [Cuscuta australis]|uniref:SPRY domain-containing protein n=1 Tax=Cuscuta australis TaxID=267555 RepID=A0A328D563_9ASTE|nr:hypothetical protein DM860_006624 [Cuscuta australis]